ncbi:Coenzyme F420 hydrogenase/dehydrogenase, beta subunit C-terminal domain [Pseudoalteromonas agarivorans]|uniref:Coenzyme F420 hydrogenase/dehydrogenase, beta subunit C-terminal domain n=1 Tax=Pseudoalteromonas agarivorans TaxID=176102 RepID=UPI0021184F80|nr:Coenzyme F420 hydrogenase/dehydrogenase, beta subunit C-terminal domain [Pseudoalteromonas agarivorans]MCQ8822209.1 Coenzyme F420 hydrogenase/dehydrogenase, beta subunit C-terminal domain [Pseudoalteromonas agarivorans]
MSSCKVIEQVVDKGLCIGCGLCVSACGNDTLKMELSDHGFLEPRHVNSCGSSCKGNCLSVCPFNPEPDDDVRTETELANTFLNDSKKQSDSIGKYINTYAGFSNEHRANSSSGGIATFTLIELLKRKEIDYVISVKEGASQNAHYEYAISSTEQELLQGAKTRYYPVTLAGVFDKVKELEGNFAIVGVPCFIKSIRLAQKVEPILKSKIKFLVGIICGGVKSTFFTEYLASKTGVSVSEYSKPEFRIKDENSSASDYSFGCLDKNSQQNTIKMKMVGDMWGTGLFKSNACDFCDDVSVELADISLGDAWIEPYRSEGLGTNVIVTRSQLAEDIICKGIETNKLTIEELPVDRFIESQRGGFNHRHNGLGFRINKRRSKGLSVPPKRFEDDNLTFLLKLIHLMRMKVRKKSLVVWKRTKNAEQFDKEMKFSLNVLKKLTKLNQYQKRYSESGAIKALVMRKVNKVLK